MGQLLMLRRSKNKVSDEDIIKKAIKGDKVSINAIINENKILYKNSFL